MNRLCIIRVYLKRPHQNCNKKALMQSINTSENSVKPETVLVLLLSNSRSEVPRVGPWYGTMAAQTRHRESVLIMFVVYLRAHVQFCRFDNRQTPQPMFSDTAFTDRHSDTTIFSSEHTWCGIYWIGKIFSTCAAGGLSYVNGEHPIY